MQQLTKKIAIFLFIFALNSLGYAGPWFTGPILAPAGHTVAKGHTNFEIYGLDVFGYGQYNGSGKVVRSPVFKTFVTNPILTHGFTDWLDVQIALPYNFNATRGVNYNRISDIATAIGVQLMEQKGSPYKADVRILFQEVFPTGKFDSLNPLLLGTDSTGLGSYQSQIGLNLQYLREIFVGHYLRTRLIVSHLYTSPVTINGLSSYGGAVNTQGKIDGVHENDADLAFEYTLTQSWVAVMEGTLSSGGVTRFRGFAGTTASGLPASVGSGSFNETALAPALEYNFNANVGLIGGVWFPVAGKNTGYFRTYVLALNAYW
ncbi:hypothetical protein [Legionella fallonii]|uniref:Fe-S protein n=1 Tax=Legionella fallonii LLAP-10 TaxID=1212491 RepID=A0A098G259_9GAMM|nr:hypothetical protein [Legionella fallonii]CEG56567.1 conserved exported protein of unknown function [Legionella fallonii LLAP-10]